MGGRRTAVAIVAALLLPVPGAPRTALAQSAPEGSLSAAPVERVAGAERLGTAVELSQLTHESVTSAVLARADDWADALVGAPLATALGGPLLLTPQDALAPIVAEELVRLGVEEVVLLGGEAALSAAVAESATALASVRRVAGPDRYATAAAVADALPAHASAVVATGADFADALAAGPYAAASGRPILLVAETSVPTATADVLARRGVVEAVVVGGEAAVSAEIAEALQAGGRSVPRIAGSTRFETALALRGAAAAEGLDPLQVWLSTAYDFPDALAAGPAVVAAGGTLLLVDGAAPGASPPVVAALRADRDALRRVVLVGGTEVLAADAVAQLAAALADVLELPRGGRRLFPAFTAVALYGSHATPRLGVLGEGTRREAAERLLAFAAPFDRPGRPVLPVMEVIVDVATSGAGADGDYSNPSTDAEVEEWIAVAREIGAYVVLDIQPGRSDFLPLVQRYERFLREPDVGVALDPEWRMGPDERPGDRVGSVDAAEVNRVVEYVAGLVREGNLPQKLFALHQFDPSMITNRDAIATPPELSVSFHIDGFGSRAAKLGSYERLLAPPPASMGFKLFLDEDTSLFQPEEVLAFERPPDLITYQ